MSRRIIVRPPAKDDLRETQDWYEAQRPGLGADFRTAVDGLLRRVSEFPLAFPQVHRGIRRAGVRRFPYLVYYSVTPDTVILVACLHSRRDPALLKSRL